MRAIRPGESLYGHGRTQRSQLGNPSDVKILAVLELPLQCSRRQCEALELREFEVAEVFALQKIRQDIVAVFVMRCRGWTCVLTDHYFEFRIRRIRGEIFVGINIK